MIDTKKNLAMMGALVAVVILMMKLRQQVSVTQISAPETAAQEMPKMGTLDPFLLPYLQTNPGIWDGQFGSDPFDKVFNVNLDTRDASEKYIPMFGFVGGGAGNSPNHYASLGAAMADVGHAPGQFNYGG